MPPFPLQLCNDVQRSSAIDTIERQEISKFILFVVNHVSVLVGQRMNGHLHMEDAVFGTLAHRYLHDIPYLTPTPSLTLRLRNQFKVYNKEAV